MNRALVSGAVAALATLTGSALATPVLLADSVADYSGTQGQGGWYYGWYASDDVSSDFGGISTDVSNFRQLGSFDNATDWWAMDSNSAGGHPTSGATPGSYTVITPDLIHANAAYPAGNISADPQWASRRWVSDFTGTLTISGHIAHYQYSALALGNGTQAYILVDGQTALQYNVAPGDFTGTDYSITLEVTEGSVIELLLGANGSPLFDATIFTAQMRGDVVPAPGALALMGLGGLVAGRRRR